jgi:hypothetical protein
MSLPADSLIPEGTLCGLLGINWRQRDALRARGLLVPDHRVGRQRLFVPERVATLRLALHDQTKTKPARR